MLYTVWPRLETSRFFLERADLAVINMRNSKQAILTLLFYTLYRIGTRNSVERLKVELKWTELGYLILLQYTYYKSYWKSHRSSFFRQIKDFTKSPQNRATQTTGWYIRSSTYNFVVNLCCLQCCLGSIIVRGKKFQQFHKLFKKFEKMKKYVPWLRLDVEILEHLLRPFHSTCLRSDHV